MSLFDKYKAVKIDQIRNKIKEEDSVSKDKSFQKNTYLKVEDGSNKFRIFPPHDPELGNFYVLNVRHWVTNYSDDGGADETYRGTVLNAAVHAGVKLDPIDEYVKMAKSFLEKQEGKEAVDKAKALVDFKTGLKRDTSYFCYAIKMAKDEREFGLFNFKTSVRNALNDEVCLPDGDDDDVEEAFDPFTDPMTGRAVIIVYNSKAKQTSDYYKVKVGKETPLTESELIIFDKATPLSELYKYSERDLMKAIEGLQIFDDTHEIGMFDDADWIEHLEEIKNQFSFSSKEDDEDDVKPAKKQEPLKNKKAAQVPAPKQSPVASKKAIVVEDEEDDEEEDDDEEEVTGDKFDAMDRTQLKEWIGEHLSENEGDEAALKVKKSMTDDDIRASIRAVAFKPIQKSITPTVTKLPAKEEPEPAKGKPTLADIKKRLAGK